MTESTIEIELLGVARMLGTREHVALETDGPVPVEGLGSLLAAAVPALVGTVVAEDGALLGGFVFARRDGSVLRDPTHRVHPGDRLMLLSLTAGG